MQDACKVGAFHLMRMYNMFGINDTGAVVLEQSTLDYRRTSEESALLGHHRNSSGH